jgi:peptide deformylase
MQILHQSVRPAHSFVKLFMARLDILHYPDARLHTIAKPVTAVDARIRQLVDDMAATMYAAPGIGLAATQVNVHERVVVIDISETHDDLLVLINPEIIARSGTEESEEGCLSVPGIYDKVTRAERVSVRALDRNGKSFELAADGLLAVCIQHEMDHLIGKVFVDYLSGLKRNRIKAKLLKQAREHRPDAAPSRASL